MFLVDDLLLSPARGLLFVFKELDKRAREELLDDEAVRQELRESYMLLETGRITEREFERRERRLVGRLEAIERMREEMR
ncbi:MAG: gas vesicle protein GvpG [Bryobacteraceae bacterium]|jgi:hypothetical protein